MDFLRTVDAITPEWLTQVLRESRAIRETAVETFEVGNVGDDQGVGAEVSRLTLGYDSRRNDSAPRTAIIKLARVENGTPIFAAPAEAHFYKLLRPTRRVVASPNPYFSEFDSQSTYFAAILLEDLGHLRAVDQTQDCSYEDARNALRTLAQQHFSWWGDEQLLDYSWLFDMFGPAAIRRSVDSFPAQLERCIENIGDLLLPGFERIARMYRDSIAETMILLGSEPHTLIHGDFRPGNLFFDDANDAPDPVIAFDWQTVARQKATIDVSYFLAWGMSTETRRRFEKQLLADYYDYLVELGLRDYSLDQFMTDIRISALLLVRRIVGPLGNSGGNMLKTDDGRKRIASMCERAQTLIDWNCDEVIPK